MFDLTRKDPLLPACASLSDDFAIRLIGASAQIGPCLESGAKITRRVLNSAMEDAFGAGSTGGAWTQRDSFQMLEIAILGAMSGRKWSADPVLTLAALRDLETQLPTQFTIRTLPKRLFPGISPVFMALGPAQNAQDAHRSATPSVTKVGTPPLAPWAKLKTVVLTPNAQDAP